jgi:hypothetical protein
MKHHHWFLSIIFLLIFTLPTAAQTDTLIINPSRDNTLYESDEGNLSNGQGEYLFIGRTNQPLIRRALLHFDVAAELPGNARVLSAELHVHVSNAVGGSQPATVHEVLRSWGEGDSKASGPRVREEKRRRVMRHGCMLSSRTITGSCPGATMPVPSLLRP